MKTAEELLDNTSHMNWLTDSQKLLVTSMMEVYKDLAIESEVKKLDLAFVSQRSELLIKFLRWQYDDEGEFTEGDKAMVKTFLEELNL